VELFYTAPAPADIPMSTLYTFWRFTLDHPVTLMLSCGWCAGGGGCLLDFIGEESSCSLRLSCHANWSLEVKVIASKVHFWSRLKQ